MFEFIVIGMVLHEESTGYDIKKKIEAGIGNLYAASHGSLYPALKRLTDKGLLTMSERMEGKRQKKYYKATEAGKAAFLEWLSLPLERNDDLEAYLAQVFLLGELPRETRKKRLEEYEFYAQQMLQQLQLVESQLSTEKTNENLSDREYFELSTFYYSYQLLHNMIRWIRYIGEQKPLSNYLRENDLS